LATPLRSLTYADFTYGKLTVMKNTDATTVVEFNLTNVGVSHKGSTKEVPQLYLGFPAQAGEPPKVLRGFRKVSLSPGQSSVVRFELSLRDRSVWDATAHAWKEINGAFTVFVGASSRDIRQSAKLNF
jgi:beta-glucosidase